MTIEDLKREAREKGTLGQSYSKWPPEAAPCTQQNVTPQATQQMYPYYDPNYGMGYPSYPAYVYPSTLHTPPMQPYVAGPYGDVAGPYGDVVGLAYTHEYAISEVPHTEVLPPGSEIIYPVPVVPPQTLEDVEAEDRERERIQEELKMKKEAEERQSVLDRLLDKIDAAKS